MQRVADERGAVAVIVALLMVPLMGFAALAIDVSALWAQKQQLQNGADAGALAIAQECLKGSCGSTAQTAQSLAAANLNSGSSTATVTSLTSNSVTVRNSSVRQHLFAPVLGIDASNVAASATVSWGVPTGGIGRLPLTFNLCEFNHYTGGGVPSDTIERTILFSKTKSPTTCAPKPGNFVPGGFGWVEVNSGTCNRRSAVSGVLSQLESDPGNSPPSSCSPADFASMRNQTVLLPVFDDWGGTGSNAYFKVHGYAAFKITGYYFASQFTYGSPLPCDGNERCIRGYFTKMVNRDASFTYGSGAPDLGSSVISLTD
jgi:Flp pilus assembly protein TadG